MHRPQTAVGSSHFINLPFNIDTYIPAAATTCPPPGVFAAHGVLNGSACRVVAPRIWSTASTRSSTSSTAASRIGT